MSLIKQFHLCDEFPITFCFFLETKCEIFQERKKYFRNIIPIYEFEGRSLKLIEDLNLFSFSKSLGIRLKI